MSKLFFREDPVLTNGEPVDERDIAGIIDEMVHAVHGESSIDRCEHGISVTVTGEFQADHRALLIGEMSDVGMSLLEE